MLFMTVLNLLNPVLVCSTWLQEPILLTFIRDGEELRHL